MQECGSVPAAGRPAGGGEGVRGVNIVFWAIVVLAMVLLWFIMSPMFKYLGGDLKGLFNRAKDEITECESEDEE